MVATKARKQMSDETQDCLLCIIAYFGSIVGSTVAYNYEAPYVLGGLSAFTFVWGTCILMNDPKPHSVATGDVSALIAASLMLNGFVSGFMAKNLYNAQHI